MNYLVKALGAGRLSMHFCQRAYDYAGFYATRFMIDHNFLDIDDTKIKSPALRKYVQLYNTGNNVVQDKFYKTVSDTLAHGNVGPKPDFKKPLIGFGSTLLTSLPKMNLSQAAVVAFTLGIGLMAAQIGTSDHSQNHASITMTLHQDRKSADTPPVPKII